MKKLLYLIPLLLFALPSYAQCTGSGLAFSCPAGTTIANIQTAVNSALDGAVITFAAGTYPFASKPPVKLSNSKGVTLICATAPLSGGAATVNPCLITSANYIVFQLDTITGINTHDYRISGFTFDAQNTGRGTGMLYFDTYNGGTHSGTLRSLRVDHNTFQNGILGTAYISISLDGVLEQIHVYGVIDHNSVTGGTQSGIVNWAVGSPTTIYPNSLGTANNLFIEDNNLNFTTMGNFSALGCTDGWGGASMVMRHNTSTNCSWTTHGATHKGGPVNVEFYSNNVTNDAGSVSAGTADCYRCFHHQGSGTFIAFNNSFTAYSGKSPSAIDMADYRAYTGVPGSAPNGKYNLTQVAVSGATTTYTVSTAGIGGGWYMIRGFSNAGNNVPFNVTSFTTTSISGVTTTQVNETGAGTAAVASQDHGAPQCDGTVTNTTAPFADGGVDGNRSPTSTYRGYPCWHQPGRDFNGNLVPMYSWNNFWSDTLAKIDINLDDFHNPDTDYFTNHLQANRDVYNSVSASAQSNATTPFNGTTGMGFGTFANRPTTCTPTPEALDAGKGGVGYFATDVGSQGTLYNCDSTNHWAVFYTPYTYPHPLVSAGTPVATFTPDTMSFGNVTQGTTSSELQMILSNSGGGTLTLTTNVSLSDTTNFTLVSADTTCVNGTNLTAGQTCIIAVKANPTGTSVYTSTLTTLSNASSSPDNDETFSVTGTAVVTPGNPIGLIGMVFSFDKYAFYRCTPYPCATACYSCSLPFGVKRPVITFK